MRRRSDTPSAPQAQEPMTPSRRRFLKAATNALTALIGLATAVPLLGYALSPVLKPDRRTRWSPIGKIEDFPDGKVTQQRYSGVLEQGWYRETAEKVVYVKRDGDEFTVFSAVCTHLGCGVRWDEAGNRFFCPCHGGVFDVTGKVVGGPPPRPLTRLRAKVQAGEVLVLEA